MRYELDSSFVDIANAVVVLRVDLLESSVLKPEIDVSSPIPLLCRWRHVCDSPFIHLAYSRWLDVLAVLLICPVGVFFQPREREPSIVVCPIVGQFLLVLDSPLAEHGQFDACAVAVLLFELGVRRIEISRFGSRKASKGKLVDDSCTFKLFQASLHLGKGSEYRLGLFHLLLLIAEELQRRLEHLARLVCCSTVLLESSPGNPVLRRRTARNPSLVDG